ncbi:MAG: hypothetical protein PHT02_01060 [Tissierellia bacterium]|nr:hypothetical protein [Tissierellia bacterium]
MNTVFCFTGMFLNHIEGLGLKLPEDLDNYNPVEYPHYHVFMTLHLARPIDVSSLHYNAELIANLSDEEIRTVTLESLINKGFCYITNSNSLM